VQPAFPHATPSFLSLVSHVLLVLCDLLSCWRIRLVMSVRTLVGSLTVAPTDSLSSPAAPPRDLALAVGRGAEQRKSEAMSVPEAGYAEPVQRQERALLLNLFENLAHPPRHECKDSCWISDCGSD
jgi:hypothetical protein